MRRVRVTKERKKKNIGSQERGDRTAKKHREK
jgi:hypothetical protein